MRHIAILTCLDACKVCTGASCLEAWNNRSRHFALYAGEDVTLSAFFHCDGCGSAPESDAGMAEKLDRLARTGVDTVHIGVCAMIDRKSETLCPTVSKIRDMLYNRGIQTILGTH